MKLRFLGAAGIVTGSCYNLITDNGENILIDCGMFQGRKKITQLNYLPFKFDPVKISHLLLTHSHIDHSGLIPKLYKFGFRGKIICTSASKDLCRAMLEDSAGIHEMETMWENKKLLRKGKPPREPLYTREDARDCMEQFKAIKYDSVVQVTKNIKAVFRDAGHILGSAIIELFVTENGKTKKIVFSGDLGQEDKPIIRDPTVINDADYLLIESTYGNRLHKEVEERKQMFLGVINRTIERGGKVLIPSFAVERTQEIIYYLNEFVELGIMPKIKVYLDSPLAINVTEIFKRHTECYDEETLSILKKMDKPFHFPGLVFTKATKESIKLNTLKDPCIIIAGNGMCTAGRIKHHLKHNLWKKEATLLFVGYQAEGTTGRRLFEGAKKIKLYGEEVQVNADVKSIGGFSAHADQKQLFNWAKFLRKKKPKKVFIVHGEQKSSEALSKLFEEKLKFNCKIPQLFEEVEL